MANLNTVAAALPMSFYVQASGVLAGCKLHTYQAGSAVNQATYQDLAGNTANSNPITLDSNGAATIRYLANTGYKLVLNDSTDTTTLASIDNFYANAPNGALFAGTDSGSANTYTVPSLGTLVAGMRVWFEPANTNTSAATLNSVAIKTPNGGALIGYEMPANQPAEFYYDGTNFVLLSQGYWQGSYTATMTGATTAPTCTVKYVRQLYEAQLFINTISATSNATGFTLTGSLPAALQPASTQAVGVPASAVTDNSAKVNTVSLLLTAASSTLTFLLGDSSSGFTNSGTKGVTRAFSVNYPLN
jgi:hypothetical protein